MSTVRLTAARALVRATARLHAVAMLAATLASVTVARVVIRAATSVATLAVAITAAIAAPALAQQPIPPLARVTDTTGTLAPAQRDALEQKLEALEARKGAQLVVLVVATTAPEDIASYSIRVAEAWGVGRGDAIDDGAILVVAKDDRRLRIEVGYGLEGAIPDAAANRVITERIVPRFYEDDYAAGISDGVDALIALIDGEPLPAPPESREPSGDDLGPLPLVFFFAMVVAPMLRRAIGALPGALVLGAGAGLVGWLMSGGLFLSLALAGVVFFFALAGVLGGPGRWSSGGGWGGRHGGFGGSVGRGGFGRGGGGGFRGGGGRFGGGGASGRW